MSARLRVVHILPHARALGGTERTVLDLLGSPVLSHVDQRVAFVRPGQVVGFPDAFVLGGRTAQTVVGGALPAVLRWRPDIVHSWLLPANLFGAAAKRVRPSVALTTSERNLGDELTGFKLRLERFVAAAEDIAIANSAAVRDAAVRRLPQRAGRMRVIRPGVRPLPAPADTRSCSAVIVGRLHPAKDHITALRAWRRVVDERPGAILTIVGDGPERAAVQAAVHRLGLEAAVRLRGDTDPAPDLYGACLFLSTSRTEGFSRAMLEALAAGRPVVATAVGGATELPGPGVRLAPVGDDAAIAAHVIDLLGAEERLEAAGAAARALSYAYAPERCHAAYADLYAELARR